VPASRTMLGRLFQGLGGKKDLPNITIDVKDFNALRAHSGTE